MAVRATAPLVYVVHDTGAKNFTPALSYGKIKVLLQGRDGQAFDTTHLVRDLRLALLPFRAHDYLILTGDPIAIGVACAVLAESFSVINLLKWDKQERVYNHAEINLREELLHV